MNERANRSSRAMMALAALSVATAATATPPAQLPADVAAQLPPGYDVLATASVSAGQPNRRFMIVALGRKGESFAHSDNASPRPLLIFEQSVGRSRAAGRNDHVVMKADQGGQCDPFLDGNATIAVKGRYFTIENGVACGAHWTDYITFRLDDGTRGFVFDNERRESWSMNASDRPDADALVRDGKPMVIKDRSGHLTPFNTWRPHD